MSVLVDWGDSDEIILIWRFDEGWTWQDARAALIQSQQLIVSTTNTVVLLVDVRRSITDPARFLRYFPELYKNLPVEITRTIFIDGNKVFYSIFKMLQFQYPHLLDRCHLVDNVDDAYRMAHLITALAI